MYDVVWYMKGWHVVMFEVTLGLIMLQLFGVWMELKEARKR